MLKVKQKRLKWLLPLLFTLYVSSITFFTHTHVINNIRYVHSHPFKTSDSPSHQHSDKELELLDQLFNSSFTSDILPEIDLTGNISGSRFQYTNLYQQVHFISPASSLQLRAPPILLLISKAFYNKKYLITSVYHKLINTLAYYRYSKQEDNSTNYIHKTDK